MIFGLILAPFESLLPDVHDISASEDRVSSDRSISSQDSSSAIESDPIQNPAERTATHFTSTIAVMATALVSGLRVLPFRWVMSVDLPSKPLALNSLAFRYLRIIGRP